ncbi:MAG TPA: hypothetical protein VF767_07400 [Bryobacteraceae bacterium]
MNRLAILAVVSVLPLAAGRIDVSNESLARVHQGAAIIADFAVWNYGMSNPGSSPYPAGINFSLLTQQPAIEAAALPESSGSYYRNYLFGAQLESLDGSVSAPLTSPVAELLGLRPGTLVLAPGVFSNGSSAESGVGVLSGWAYLSPQTAAALFGESLAARIVLRNLGPEVWIGAGQGYTVRNSVSEPGLTGEGPRSVGGLTRTVTVANPEPGTWMLAVGALAALLFSNLRSSAARVCKRGRSRV